MQAATHQGPASATDPASSPERERWKYMSSSVGQYWAAPWQKSGQKYGFVGPLAPRLTPYLTALSHPGSVTFMYLSPRLYSLGCREGPGAGVQGRGQHSCAPSSDCPLGKVLGGPRGALPLPHLEPQASHTRHGPVCTEQAASPPAPRPTHTWPRRPQKPSALRALPQLGVIPRPGPSCCGQQGGGASTEKGQLGMEIPLVFSHGQQGLFKEYIQLKIDFSV